MIAAFSTTGQAARVATALPQGPAGPPGPIGGDIVVPAAVDLPGHRVVCLDQAGHAVLASSDDVACAWCLGVTRGAASAGSPVTVKRIGEINDPSFAFAIGPVFLGPAGALTQIAPTSGLRLQVGFALSPTRLYVHPRPPTIMAP